MDSVKANPQIPGHKSSSGLLNVALLIEDTDSTETSVSAIRHLVSNCAVKALVVMKSTEEEARSWLLRLRVATTKEEAEQLEIWLGDEGFHTLLQLPSVDAVFVMLPATTQHTYVLRSLKANKHVLLRDRYSQPYDEYLSELYVSKAVRRFLQSSTMFVHHHRVKTFLEVVLYEKFGPIETIDAKLLVNYADVDLVGAQLPLTPADGCIRRVGRFCVLITVLIFSRAGSRPISAEVTKLEENYETGNLSANCVVHFTDNRVLKFHAGYTSIPTRQVLEVQARERYATMTHFVIPHKDGLATYRTYEKEKDPVTGKLQVVRGEALDIPSAPPQDVMMWRRFADLCHAVEENGYVGERTAGAREMANMAIYTKRVLIALEESVRQKAVVPVIVEDFISE